LATGNEALMAIWEENVRKSQKFCFLTQNDVCWTRNPTSGSRYVTNVMNTIEANESTAGRSLLAMTPARWLRSAIDLIYPPTCANCAVSLEEDHGADGLICQACRELFIPQDIQWCRRCGAPTTNVEACSHCQRKRYAFAEVHPLGLYEADLRMAILRMKRYHQYPLRAAMGQLLAAELHGRIAADQIDIVVPVPMHWTRRLMRGTNSPETLARCLARAIKRPLGSNLMRRSRLTRPQSDLHFKERGPNVRGAFSMKRGSKVSGARILLVDDILTTGATCHEVSRTLRAAGAKQVCVAVVGRTKGSGK
jgi:ComF family protein